MRQPGGIALDVFDARIAGIARQFEDFRAAERGGALLIGATRSRTSPRACACRCEALARRISARSKR